jgi:aryl-alcohol dehydrogenase-like predicted oxidoreductase
VADSVLGRTNRAFPPVWLSLSLPPTGGETAIDGLVNAAREANVPLDISGNPALFGGRMRGDDDLFLTQFSTAGYERANDDQHAGDLIQAHLIETLSAIGREWIDVYYLRVRQAVDEAQLSGALEAMEMARQEGHIRHLAIVCDGSSLATLGLWQFHDAFDLLLVPRNHFEDEDYRTLAPLAKERRVGVVTYNPLSGLPLQDPLAQAAIGDLAKDHPVLVKVRTPEEVAIALAAPGVVVPDFLEHLHARELVA